jgi:hypothetical protein
MSGLRSIDPRPISLLAAAAMLAACSFDATSSSEPGSAYDALLGTWAATTFVVSQRHQPGYDAHDLARSSGGDEFGYEITLAFRLDRTGCLEIVETGESASREVHSDEFSVLSLDDRTMSLALGADGHEQPRAAEHFLSKRNGGLTLKLTYPLDLDGDGVREETLVVGTFQKTD